MLVSSGKRAGRSHRDRRVPCQDSYAVHQVEGEDRIAAAVADGLGSRPLSHVGSEVAAQAAAKSLAASHRWGPGAVHRAFRAARRALDERAQKMTVSVDELATTLQVVGLSPGKTVAGIVGDGAVLCAAPEPRILLGPEDSEYANMVAPITDPNWTDHLRVATTDRVDRAFVFTDGLTRLLMTRNGHGWQPHAPFFDAILPRLATTRFDPGFVERFLASDRIDAAWDDDKCLVVVGLD